MKNKTLGRSLGFTLVELLVVIAIIGVVAAVTALNVAAFSGFEPCTILTAASYTIYVEEEGGVQRNIGTLDLGDMLIQYPRRMNIGDSKEVLLSLVPLEDSMSEYGVVGGSTDEGSYYVVSEKVELYSVMCAELKAPTFMISSDFAQYKEVSFTSSTDWVWVVTPNAVGEQLLIIELTTPVRVEGYEGLVSRAVYSEHIHVLVREPFSWKTLLDYWYIIVLTIGATVAAVFGLLKLRKVMKRKKTQNAKE
jgi:prepilin-type N-terminal cleavage/methylation domain-containing protein